MNDEDLTWTEATQRVLGKGPMGPNRHGLETIDRAAPGQVVFTSYELTAQCPLTGQPDLYNVTILLEGYRTLESKSLKLYLWSWAGEGVFAEHLADTIADDVYAITGEDVKVELTQNVRGGIVTTVRAERPGPPPIY